MSAMARQWRLGLQVIAAQYMPTLYLKVSRARARINGQLKRTRRQETQVVTAFGALIGNQPWTLWVLAVITGTASGSVVVAAAAAVRAAERRRFAREFAAIADEHVEDIHAGWRAR